MSTRTSTRIFKRLRSLAALELINIPLQAAIWFDWVPWLGFSFPMTAVNAAGFGLFSLLLVQGAAYWRAKLRMLATPGAGGALPLRRAFAAARVLNPVLLAAGVLVTLWATVDRPGQATVPGLGFALFAVLEQVNYFHRQLMYRNVAELRRGGLRRAHLARDLDRHRAHTSRRRIAR